MKKFINDLLGTLYLFILGGCKDAFDVTESGLHDGDNVTSELIDDIQKIK